MNNVLILNNNQEIVSIQDKINHKVKRLISKLIKFKILNKMKLIIIKYLNSQVIYHLKNQKEVQKVQIKLKDFKNQ